VGLLNLLFGKKEKPVPAPPPVNRESAAPAKDKPTAATPPSAAAALSREAENLQRWRESGQAGSWVEAHHGQWNHADWLELVETLKRSVYWPLQPEEVGKVLEEVKRSRQPRS
jgi:hypothetical protein